MMNRNDFQRQIDTCPDLAGTGPISLENLFCRAENQTLQGGQILFRQGARLDDTFGVLLSGQLAVERSGDTISAVTPHQIFGEMAYFSQFRSRNATIRVSSSEAAILKFRVSPIELGSRGFSVLRRYLANLAVSRSVSPSPILIA